MRIYIISIFFLLFNIQGLAQSANWSALKPDFFPTNVSGQIHGLSRVSQLKFHPTNPNKMYAISARGGLFISSNAGTTWAVAPGTDFMPYARLASVCVDYTNDQVLYLGTGDHNYYYSGSGVWKSTNGGTTFSPLGLSGRLVADMIMDPLDNNKIVAITDAGIYKTSNAGVSWSLKTAAREFDDLQQKTATSRVLFAATTDSAFFRSTDFGETWNQITTGIVLPAGITNGNGCRVAVTPADSNIVYLGMVANGGLIYKSVDGGTTFSAIKTTASPYLTYYTNSSTSSTQGDYNFGIGVDRVDPNILYLVAHCVWKSTNGGVTWTQLSNWWAEVHTDMHQIVTNPYNNNQLYNMNDGGVWLSTNGGVNWTPKSDGLNGYEIYHGNCSPTRRDMMSIGTQDNGELYSTTAGWFTNRGGDWGSQCAFDYRTNSSMVYYFQSNKRRLVTGGESTYGLPTRVTNLDDITFHRSNPDLAFVADSFIYRTTNLTNTTPAWTQIAALGKSLKAIHSSFADPNRLYIIANDATIYVSNNALSATPTFTMYTLPNSTNNRASITTIKTAPDVIYVTCNTKVYRSSDNGATWTNITYNLPSVNHVRVLADEFYSLNELVLIASGNTVYYKIGSSNTWSIFNTNLPSRTDAIDLSIYNDSTTNTILRYACYGRSVWETPITVLRNVAANFYANSTNPCPGTSVQFTDASTGNINSRSWSFPGGTPSTSTAINPVVTYASAGTYTVSLTVSDGTTSNTKTTNNYISTFGASLPLLEGFEGVDNPPIGWKNIDNSTAGIAWAKVTTSGGYGASPSSMMFDNYSWNYPNEKDELIVMPLNLSSFTSLKLKFDVAYQVFSGYSDSLAILISTNCGASYTKVYQKGGTVLSTAGSGGNNFVPTSTQWRTDSVVLNAYLGQPNVLIAFQNINGYGNKLYIDNINVTGTCSAPTLPTLTATQNTLCHGQNTTLSVTAGTLNSANSWNWYSGSCGGTYVGSGSSIVVTPSTTTTYFARGEGGCVNGGTCSSITINVNQLPAVTASNVSGCAGNAISLNGTPLGGTYSVSNPYLGSSTSYTYSFTDVNGCTNSSTPAAITVHSLPNVNATAAPNDSICLGSPLTLIGTGAVSYSWSNGLTSPSNNVAFTNATTSIYTVTGTDANNCNASSTVFIKVFNETPTTTGTTRCGSGVVNLNASGSGTINWYTNVTGGSPIHTGNSYSPSIAATTTYHVSNTHLIGTTGSITNVGPTSNAIGSGLQSTLNQWALFNVLQPCTLVSVVVYPGAAGNVVLEQRNSTGTTVLNTTTLAVSAAQVNTPVTMTLNWPLSVGTGYRLYRVATGVSLYRNSTGAVYPYSNSAISITGNSLNPLYYYWAYNWTVSNLINNYCTSTRVPVTGIVNPLPTVTASNVTGCSGSPITLVGSPANGTFSLPNPYTGPSTTYTYSYTDFNGCSNSSSPASITVAPCASVVNLKIFLEGYYIGAGFMTPVLMNEGIGSSNVNTDSIEVELRNINSPYSIVASTKAMLHTDGTAQCIFPALNGMYYIAIKHRNTLWTWSALPVSISSLTTYDFTDLSSKAYGNNMKQMEPNVWAMYSGELNADDNLDLLDATIVENDVSGFLFGYYATDLNGDGNVDLLDNPIAEININAFVFSQHP